MHFFRSIPYHRRTLYGGLTLGILMTLVGLFGFQGLSIFNRAELAAYDWQFNLRGSLPTPNDMVVVGLDDGSIQSVSNGRYPIPRAAVGQVVNTLHRDGARVIGIDFTYLNPSTYGPADDAKFVAAIRRAGNVVLNQELETGPTSNDVGGGTSLSLPIDPLPSVAAGLGLDNVPTDADNEIRRAMPLQFGFGQKYYPVFPLVVAALAEHKSVSALAHTFPSQIYINYVGPQAAGDNSLQSWQQVPFDTVGEDAPSIFRNKIVLIIPAAVVTHDDHQTPFGDTWGGFVQANTVETMLHNDPIVPAGNTANGIVIIILGLLTAIFASRFGILHGAAAAIGLAVLYPIATVIAFQHERFWLYLVTPEATLVLVFAAVMGFRFATEERQKRRIRGHFTQYLEPDVVDILVNATSENVLAGQRQPVSVLFVDIRGSTAMAEHMRPEDVIRVMDIYLEDLSTCVKREAGLVNKYVGDELMATWNTPRMQPDHALRAVRCALDMVAHMEAIGDQLASADLPRIRFGVGVNSGEAIVGAMGSSIRKQYDVLGDTINTGARLCSAAEGGQVIIGQRTWEQIGDRLVVEETEPLTLKGKSEQLRTFRVLAVQDSAPATSEVLTATA